MPPLRAMLRLAWRDAFRNRARSLLVMALVGVPVAGLVGLSSLLTGPTPEQGAVRLMGQADVLIYGSEPPPREMLPGGTTLEPFGSVSLTLVDGGEPIDLLAYAMSLDGMAADRYYEVVEGRAPAADGEVALAPELLDALNASIGDKLELANGSSITVTGSIHDRQGFPHPAAVVSVEQEGMRVEEWLVDTPDTADATQVADQLADDGYSADSREWMLVGDDGPTVVLFVLGGLALLATGLVAEAAFAVSVRRRQRELGVVAATGGDARHLRHVVLANGIVLGGLGSLTGAALGIAIAFTLTPALEDWARGNVRINPWIVLAAVCLGLLAATLSAWWPARTVARVPVMVALSGRRPVTTSSRRALLIGAALIAVGVVLMVVAIREQLYPMAGAYPNERWVSGLMLAATVAIVAGFGGVSPWALERLGLLARWLPVGLRLAVRDVGRYRTRNGPVVTAILGMLAMSVMWSANTASMDALYRREYVPSLREDQIVVEGPMAAGVAARLAERDETIAVGEVAIATVEGEDLYLGGVEAPDASAETSSDGGVAIGDGGLVRALGGDDAAVAALERGDVLLFDDGFAGRDTVRTWFETGATGRIALDATVVNVASNATWVPNVVATAETVQRLAGDAEVVAQPMWELSTRILRFDRPVTDELAREARSLAARGVSTTVTIESGYISSDASLDRALLIGALLTSMLVLAIALALTATESRNDERALLEIGTDPAVRRRMAAGRALVLAGLGSLLAIPAGLLPGVGILMSSGMGARLVVPWTTVAVIVVGMPLIACLGAYILTRSTPNWTRFIPRMS